MSVHSLFLMSFSSLRMREDSCSGVGALNDREGPSPPEGGVGSLCLKRSSMLLCSLRFRPYTHEHRGNHKALKKTSVSKIRGKCQTKSVSKCKVAVLKELFHILGNKLICFLPKAR